MATPCGSQTDSSRSRHPYTRPLVAQVCYTPGVNEVELTADAVRQYKRLRKLDRRFVREAIQKHLAEGNTLETSRNKFRLRRLSTHADYELRASDFRIFYRVVENRVLVTLIGVKQGDRLIIEGEEFEL